MKEVQRQICLEEQNESLFIFKPELLLTSSRVSEGSSGPMSFIADTLLTSRSADSFPAYPGTQQSWDHQLWWKQS